MSGKTEATIQMNPEFLRNVQNAAKAGVRDCFKTEIVPAAKANSPKATGDNAESIAVRIKSYPGKVFAKIFTQSGHGGYIEKGTSKMAATPYIFPAVQTGLANLGGYVRARLEEFFANAGQEVPDELIGEAVGRIKSSTDKGAGIVGAKDEKKKQALRRLKRGL